MVTGSCSWQNDTTCLCHMLALTSQHPAGPKEESETGGPRTKAPLKKLQTWGKTEKSQQTLDKGMSDTQMKWD